MSRACLILLAAIVPCLIGIAAHAQETPVAANDDISAEARAAIAQRLLTPTRKPRCDESSADGAIVVCGNNEENERQRLPIPSTPDSSRINGDGTPRAPNVFGIKDNGGIKVGGCFLPPCPPPLMPDIDFSKLPPPPAGSDADRIAKGEIRAP